MPTPFTIRSTELRDYSAKHFCTLLEVVSGEPGREKLLVEVDPPIPGHIYNRSQDLDMIVVSPRHDGTSLLPEISEWPCRVYICVPENGGSWSAGPFRVLDWGIIEKPDER
jgi:hypothetical protein